MADDTTLRQMIAGRETSLQLACIAEELDVFQFWTVDAAIEDHVHLIVLGDEVADDPRGPAVMGEILEILAEIDAERREARIASGEPTNTDLLYSTTMRQSLANRPDWTDWFDGPRDRRAVEILMARPEVMDIALVEILRDPEAFKANVDRYDGQALSKEVRKRVVREILYCNLVPESLLQWWERGQIYRPRLEIELERELVSLTGESHLDLALASLPPRHAEVLRLRYGIDDGVPLKLADVGARLGISQSRSMQIVQKGIRHLKAYMYRHGVKPTDEIAPAVWSLLADSRGLCDPDFWQKWPDGMDGRQRLLLDVAGFWSPKEFIEKYGRELLSGWEFDERRPAPVSEEIPDDDADAVASIHRF